jgi:predicted DNA-binding transcriptional regulator AlpA
MRTISHDPAKPTDYVSPRKAHRECGDLSATTVWRMRQRGEFPEPIQISPGRKAYRRADLEEWKAARVAASRAAR